MSLQPDGWPNRAWVTVAIAAGLFCGLWLATGLYSATGWQAFPQFLLAIGIIFVLPGWLVMRGLGISATPLEATALATGLGMVATCIIYFLCCWQQAPGLVWVWLLVCLGAAAQQVWRCRPVRIAPRLEHLLLLLVLAVVWLPLLTMPSYFSNLTYAPDGSLSYSPQFPDFTFHMAIAGELTHTIPPQQPYLSGLPLGYHIGMDLVTAVLARFGGLSIADLVVRFCPLLFSTLVTSSVFCLGRRLLESAWAAAALAFLTVLGEDLFFLPGLLMHFRFFVGSPIVYSIYNFNPMVMALGLFFLGLLCLHRAMSQAQPNWYLAAALCLASLIEIKVFVYIVLAFSLIVAAALDYLVRRRTTLMRFGLLLAAVSVPLILFSVQTSAHGSDVTWRLASGLSGHIEPMIQRLGLPLLGGITAAILLPVYVAAAFGYRMLGATELVKALKSGSATPFACLLAVFVLIGPVLTYTTAVVPRTNPGYYDNAAWFMCASQFVAPIFAVMALQRIWPTVRSKWLLVVLVAALSLPKTIEFVVYSSWPVSRWSWHRPEAVWNTQQMAAIKVLNKAAAPGAVVLSVTPGMEKPVITLTALRQPYAEFAYGTDYIRPDVAQARKRDVQAFRQAWLTGNLDTDVLARYDVTWILAPHGQTPASRSHARLQTEFDNSEITLYRVVLPDRTAITVPAVMP